ncbi:MAG: hypothetical protein LLG37_04275 [Spirochaetia bacterium]|nr:hypothetical protein [Spirochaetia bacterium]
MIQGPVKPEVPEPHRHNAVKKTAVAAFGVLIIILVIYCFRGSCGKEGALPGYSMADRIGLDNRNSGMTGSLELWIDDKIFKSAGNECRHRTGYSDEPGEFKNAVIILRGQNGKPSETRSDEAPCTGILEVKDAYADGRSLFCILSNPRTEFRSPFYDLDFHAYYSITDGKLNREFVIEESLYANHKFLPARSGGGKDCLYVSSSNFKGTPSGYETT